MGNRTVSTPLASAPDWLLEFVTSRNSGESAEFLGEVSREDLELRSATGDLEGQRHNRALELICRDLGRGMNPSEVLRNAQEWGDRCSPPMDREEIRRIVDDLASKEAEKFEQEPLPEAKPWPVLDGAAFHGLAG